MIYSVSSHREPETRVGENRKLCWSRLRFLRWYSVVVQKNPQVAIMNLFLDIGI